MAGKQRAEVPLGVVQPPLSDRFQRKQQSPLLVRQRAVDRVPRHAQAFVRQAGHQIPALRLGIVFIWMGVRRDGVDLDTVVAHVLRIVDKSIP